MASDHPKLYYVDAAYLRHLRQYDTRVSVKNRRPFVGVVTVIKGQMYVIPLTSQTTLLRKQAGKKKRSALITSFITETSGVEISNLLYNNMVPVFDRVITPLSIDPTVDTYESNEIRFIRKTWDKIQDKAQTVYEARYNQDSDHYTFLCKTCCDFQKLEKACLSYQASLLSSCL